MRAGHTEASIDLVRLAGMSSESAILCEIVNDDGTMKRGADLVAFAQQNGLKIGTIADLIRHRLQTEKSVERVLERDVETEFGKFRLYGYRDQLSPLPHFALVQGAVDDGEPVLTRVHVRDTASDVLHLAPPDGALSLTTAFRHVAAKGRGVVVVLGDANEARHALERVEKFGAARDGDHATQWRRHGIGAQILADLGVRRLIVLGTQRRFLGIGGFGLEVVGYEQP
jgi:3,4-dihydroxy 2-butanone 4-phosphate synthase/GTP cyclohydrolase II